MKDATTPIEFVWRGEHQKQLREDLGLSVERLAELTGIGASSVVIYERGQRPRDAIVAARIAHALGVEVEDLLMAVAP